MPARTLDGVDFARLANLPRSVLRLGKPLYAGEADHRAREIYRNREQKRNYHRFSEQQASETVFLAFNHKSEQDELDVLRQYYIDNEELLSVPAYFEQQRCVPNHRVFSRGRDHFGS